MEDFDESDMENERDEEAELPFLGTGENTEEFQPEEEEVSEVLLEDVEIPAIRAALQPTSLHPLLRQLLKSSLQLRRARQHGMNLQERL